MWKNLSPKLTRQRIIIEGTTEKIVEPKQIEIYLLKLSKVLETKIRSQPLTYSAEDKDQGSWSAINMGYAGWLYWVSSGIHFHSYPTSPPLFTVDAYTCKLISIEKAVAFTKMFLKPKEIVWKEIIF